MSRLAFLAWLTLGSAFSVVGCSLGQGEGAVRSENLFAPECWTGPYDMQPNFFAAVPYRETLQIRVQRGSDIQEVSDGLAVQVDDVSRIRAEHIGRDLPVALPPGVAPPGSPVGAEPRAASDPPLVHMTLYLQGSCNSANVALHAVRGTIRFRALFSGDPNEQSAAEKFTDAEFDVLMGDPRDAPLGGQPEAIPTDRQSRVTGAFRFYFERGQPGQPFP